MVSIHKHSVGGITINSDAGHSPSGRWEGMPIFYAMGKLSKDSSFFLNFIRLLACQMVVLGHLLIYCYPPATGNAALFGQMMATSGVILFFIISGLLISRSLLSKMDDGDYGFGSYLVDRFSRIYSGLVPCLMIITLADLTLSYLNPDQYLIISHSTERSRPGPPGMEPRDVAAVRCIVLDPDGRDPGVVLASVGHPLLWIRSAAVDIGHRVVALHAVRLGRHRMVCAEAEEPRRFRPGAGRFADHHHRVPGGKHHPDRPVVRRSGHHIS